MLRCGTGLIEADVSYVDQWLAGFAEAFLIN
jgi:hypothetical protein